MFTYNPARYSTSPWQIHVLRIVSALAFFVGLGILYSDYHFINSSSATAGIVSKGNNSPSLSFGKNQYSHPDTYYFEYQFLVNGRNYSGHGALDYNPGPTVTIYYNRFDPAYNRVDIPDTTIPRNMTILGLLFTLGLFPWRWLRSNLFSRTTRKS